MGSRHGWSANGPALTHTSHTEVLVGFRWARFGEHAKRTSESRRANAAYVGNVYRMAAGAGGSISSGLPSAADHGPPPPAIQKPGDRRSSSR
jgi:hypothetical protein